MRRVALFSGTRAGRVGSIRHACAQASSVMTTRNRLPRRLFPIAQPSLLTAIGVHYIDSVEPIPDAVAHAGELASVGREGGEVIAGWIVRQPAHTAAAGVHDVELVVARLVAHEHDLASVGRERRGEARGVMRQLPPVTAVRVHEDDVGSVVEGDLPVPAGEGAARGPWSYDQQPEDRE